MSYCKNVKLNLTNLGGNFGRSTASASNNPTPSAFVPDHCGHAQLSNVVDVELQYGETFSYFFRTGESASGRSAVDFFIDFMSRTCGDEKFNNILEVGCNDLFWSVFQLSQYLFLRITQTKLTPALIGAYAMPSHSATNIKLSI